MTSITRRQFLTTLASASAGSLALGAVPAWARRRAAPHHWQTDPPAPPVDMIIRNDWPELIPILNKGIAAITPEEHRAIRVRWLAQADGAAVQRDPGLSDEERTWLAQHPLVRVAIGSDWAPIEWQPAWHLHRLFTASRRCAGGPFRDRR